MTISVKSPLHPKLISNSHYKNFFFAVFIILLISIITFLSFQFWSYTNETNSKYRPIQLKNIRSLPKVQVQLQSSQPQTPYNAQCNFWDCFNIYLCGRTGHDRIAVYVYPLKSYVDDNGSTATGIMSKQYYTILDTIVKSKYYTANPEEACLFIPSIDTLNQETINLNVTSAALTSLPFWSNGENHLIFNMIAGEAPNYSPVIELNTGKAMIAGADFDSYTYRPGFDVLLPVYSPFAHQAIPKGSINVRPFLAMSTQIAIDPYYSEEIQKLSYNHPELLILDECGTQNYSTRCDIITKDMYPYPRVLQQSVFCFVFRGERMGQSVLLEAMAANCIPVVIVDSAVMPFNDVIDWKRAAIFVMEKYLGGVVEKLKGISAERVAEMQRQLRFLYEKYFGSLEKITETVLDVIQDRVYPHLRRNYDDWNLRPEEIVKNPLFLPVTAPRSQGFTAVILTYDRVESLFLLIKKLSIVPSLMKVIVVWNNQKKNPPQLKDFPQINKPIKVIRTKANKLSNRFYPYEEIHTEAVLSIDDDIVMLTADELEFGYEVWREFPDRIVGFPSRTHIWDNVTNSWKYESEWTNEISMVLTGAAFFHKYWSYLYTTQMPSEVKDWVDEHMNCEDIAMNFLVANITNKPPIKVTPRKKFKCPECVNNEMLSADLGHMVERSKCVDRFAKVFGRMPLISVEFRADPVLFKDAFPEKLKRFNNIGSL